MTSTIFVRLAGGLGNQLFQFAAAKNLAVARGLAPSCICLDTRFLSGYEAKHKFEIGFLVRLFADARTGKPDSTLAALAMQFRLGRLLGCGIGSVQFISSAAHLKAAASASVNAAYYLLDGYFQHPEILFTEQQRVSVQNFLLSEKAPLIDAIKQGKPSIGVHIRRGDYVSSKAASRVFRTIQVDYYRAALERLPLDRRILVFSDDRDLSATFAAKIGGIDTGQLNLPLEDEFCLLMSCDDYVIANSTFSWWAAYLGHQTRKRTCSPRLWYHDTQRSRSNPLLLPYFELLNA